MDDIPKTKEPAGPSGLPIANGLLLVVVGFVLSRLYVWWLGVRFETSALEWYWQVLDPQLLSDRLAESVFYLHAQPPLFNLALGAGLKLAGANSQAFFQLVFLALGLALAVVIYLLLIRFGLSQLIAAVLVLLYATSPNWLMYEWWLFYDFPNAAALVMAGFALVQYARGPSTSWLVVYFAIACAVVLTRSLFHPVWFLGCIVLVMAAERRRWRTVAAISLVPLLVILAVAAKNQAVFGFFGSSSWLGMSLARATTGRLAPPEREAMVRQGRLSKVALVPPFSPVESYESVGVEVTDCGIPALGWRLRSTGAPNFNHLAFVDVSSSYLTDALTVMSDRPGLYLDSVAGAAGRFFWSPVNYPPFRDNLVATASTYRLFESTVNLPPVAFMLGLLAFSYGGLRAWRRVRGRGSPMDLFFVWSVCTISWVFVVSSLLEYGENFRFRFAVEPLAFLILSAILADLLRGNLFNVQHGRQSMER
jgi:hypothetical protein